MFGVDGSMIDLLFFSHIFHGRGGGGNERLSRKEPHLWLKNFHIQGDSNLEH